MSDFDQQLKEAVKTALARHTNPKALLPDVLDAALADIKQAFRDDGWLRTVDVSMPAYTNYDKPKVMTGQEWYDRFEKELWVPPKQEYKLGANDDGESHDRFYRNGGSNFMYTRAIEAAKKAAGIDGITGTVVEGPSSENYQYTPINHGSASVRKVA
jgi:hypothetical protein